MPYKHNDSHHKIPKDKYRVKNLAGMLFAASAIALRCEVDNERYASAFALSVIALEEIGKSRIERRRGGICAGVMGIVFLRAGKCRRLAWR